MTSARTGTSAPVLSVTAISIPLGMMSLIMVNPMPTRAVPGAITEQRDECKAARIKTTVQGEIDYLEFKIEKLGKARSHLALLLEIDWDSATPLPGRYG